MKRIAVIGLTAFYLLLTTGMFVCTMHCSAEGLMAKASMQMSGNKTDHCKSDKPCDCCKKHGSFVIKENIKPDFTIQFGQHPASIAPTQHLINYQAVAIIANVDTQISGKAPPWKSGRSISILFRSLLI
ncbi:hypothetical protein JN11_04489 [Mucilaginibacter frigoritolerans]|uniref:Uncharacterized protein n=1 Tax=Mucilaginibacter frigoritolerans TaxID=652788 RepID=A0A562TQF5_9SPHI|nr:hypothetical protein [Mucilaginibacter frigoritolerans]TWI95060.1 hypothetical protein JN11_04489 [Mucilaginibacter frigoritolerans]